MNAKTEELLYFMLWSCESLVSPTYHAFNGSFAGWAYQNGLGRRLAELERLKLLECDPGAEKRRGAPNLDRAYRLTEAGRVHALGGRDPLAEWSRTWDGVWRIVSFDLPEAEATLRNRLRRELRRQGFGHLQDSAWVSPHHLQVPPGRTGAADTGVDARSLIVFEARPCAGESDQDIVSAAWDFDRINDNFKRHLEVLSDRPVGVIGGETEAQALRSWAQREREAWRRACTDDPLLPEVLWPEGYLGRAAWTRRQSALAEAGVVANTYQAVEPVG